MIEVVVCALLGFVFGWVVSWRSTSYRYYRVGLADGAVIAHAATNNERMRVYSLRRAAEVRRKEGVSLDLPTEGEP